MEWNFNWIFPAWLVWFVIGIGLAFLELLLPGFVIIFMGIGCVMVAGVLLIWQLTVTQQVLLFLLFTIASIVLLRKWLMRIFTGLSSVQSEAEFNDFPEGAHVKVEKRVTPRANGRVRFRGTLWDAAADETIEEGEYAEIVKYAGESRQVFFVKKL